MGTIDNTRESAIERLKQRLPEGTFVYSLVRHRTPGGVWSIEFFMAEDNRIVTLTWLIAKALPYALDEKYGGVKTTGGGFDVVYELGQALHGNGYALHHVALA